MMRKASIGVVVLVLAAIVVSVFSWRGRAAEPGKVAIDADDIGGIEREVDAVQRPMPAVLSGDVDE